MKLWITRTEPGASRLAAHLREKGFDVFVKPVLRIVAEVTDPPVGVFDVAIFLSEHSVAHAFADEPARSDRSGHARTAGTDRDWLPSAAIAIGRGTARALTSRGIDALVPARASSEGVVEMFASGAVSFARPLIVAGVGGRELLAEWFAERGIEVGRWLVYRREEDANPLPSADGIDAIIVGSGAGLRVVAKLWFAAGGGAAVWLLAPSDRVAVMARERGFERVTVSEGAGAGAIETALEELF